MDKLLLAILGLTFGSFLGVVTSRLPRKESFVKGRSHCPRCGKEITWYDNIPLLSFVLLAGKCRYCRKPISFRYPAIEVATGIGFVLVAFIWKNCYSGTVCGWKASLGPASLPFILSVLLLTIAIFVVDSEKKIIPDELVFSGFLLTLAALFFGKSENFYGHLWAGFVAGFFLLLVHLATSGRGMGLGDVKYALFAGAFLGPSQALIWLFLAFLTGGTAGIILILLGRSHLKSQIAFGPFLALAFLLTAIFGENLLKLFMTL